MPSKTIFFGLFHTLGDIIASTALIRAIKNKYPDSHLTYAVGKQYYDVLTYNPDIQEIIPCVHPDEIVLRAAEKQYDKVYLPLMRTQEDTLWHQRSPWCIDGGRHNLIDFYASRCEDDLTVEDRRTFIYPQEHHYEEIVKNIPDQFKDDFKKLPFITVHTTSRNPSKDWPYEKFNELVNKIKDKYKDRFLIYQVGGKEDKELIKPIVVPMMGIPILNTASLIRKSLLHIDIDSGPSFISDSLDVPTICIMGATNSNMAGPIGPNTIFIDPPVRKCIGTATHCVCATRCLINDDCIKTILSDEVFDKFCELIDPILMSKNI